MRDDVSDASSAAGEASPTYRMMTRVERAACGSLCACLAVAVMSAVALVYLTVIVYLPSQRELAFGLGQMPVMCTTVETRHVAGDVETCRWSSCTEWCLSRGGGDCTHIYVGVRSNGTEVDFEECAPVEQRVCPSLDLAKADKANCKEDGECSRLHGTFVCDDGACANITDVQACSFDPAFADSPVSCETKRNCVDLSGTYECRYGRCSRLHKWSCERRCRDLSLSGQNFILHSGDRILLASCGRAVARQTGETVWAASPGDGDILYVTCTDYSVSGDLISAADCLNGTVLPGRELKPRANYTALVSAVNRLGYSHRLDGQNGLLPFEQDVTIFKRSRLLINTEGCVNTLADECLSFYERYSKDGRNHTSPARFPCHYAPGKPDFVVRDFDPQRTKYRFLLFFLVPATALVVSCGSLLACSRLLHVDQTGQMAIVCCGGGNEDHADKVKSDREPLEYRGRRANGADDL